MNLLLCPKCGTVYSNQWCPICRIKKHEKLSESIPGRKTGFPKKIIKKKINFMEEYFNSFLKCEPAQSEFAFETLVRDVKTNFFHPSLNSDFSEYNHMATIYPDLTETLYHEYCTSGFRWHF